MSRNYNDTGQMGDMLEEFDSIVRMAGEHPDLIDAMDLNFLNSVNDRRCQYGENTIVSVKQVKWIRDIRRKLIAGGAKEDEDADAGLEPTDARFGGEG